MNQRSDDIVRVSAIGLDPSFTIGVITSVDA